MPNNFARMRRRRQATAGVVESCSILVVGLFLTAVVHIWLADTGSGCCVVEALSTTPSARPFRFLLVGGSGQIGKAVAQHLLWRQAAQRDVAVASICLVGRNAAKGQAALNELKQEQLRLQQLEHSADCDDHDSTKTATATSLSFVAVGDIWPAGPPLQHLLNNCDCVIHTAGPYGGDRTPTLLQAAIASPACRVYVDVSDPLPFLEQSLQLDQAAVQSNTTALIAAGAFPGMSNVLAMQAAAALTTESRRIDKNHDIPHDVYFQYFTAGLGGSGAVNLYITNAGFGEPAVQYHGGVWREFKALSGLLLGTVDFGLLDLPAETTLTTTTTTTATTAAEISRCDKRTMIQAMQNRVGNKKVFAWPFPEAATVAKELNISGKSIAAMGTAPDIWNVMLAILVAIIPRSWWRNRAFCQFLADFSQPIVRLSDAYLKATDPAGRGGETHGMRVDVTRPDGSGYSIVQGRDSFRTCVGQSCAEFALDCLWHPYPHGVALPEQRYRDPEACQRIVERLTSTPGTFCYSGPVAVDDIPGPSDLESALERANHDEVNGRV